MCPHRTFSSFQGFHVFAPCAFLFPPSRLYPGSTKVAGVLPRPPSELNTLTAVQKSLAFVGIFMNVRCPKNSLFQLLQWVACLTFQYFVLANSGITCGKVRTHVSSILMVFNIRRWIIWMQIQREKQHEGTFFKDRRCYFKICSRCSMYRFLQR